MASLFKQIVDENFPNLWKELDPRIQKTHRPPNYLNPQRPSPRHIVLKLPKIHEKERIFKASREKKAVTSKGNPIELSWALCRWKGHLQGPERSLQ